MPNIICMGCEQRVPLWDDIEQCFASREIQQRVRDLRKESAIVLSNQSKGRALVGEVISTVALAGQIRREFSVSDQGIGMENEFTDDAHEAINRKVYPHLKSGGSYPGRDERRLVILGRGFLAPLRGLCALVGAFPAMNRWAIGGRPSRDYSALACFFHVSAGLLGRPSLAGHFKKIVKNKGFS